MAAPPIRPFARLPGGLAPLGYRNYLLYWIGFAVSNTGRWIELTGVVWLVTELTDSPVLLGLLGIARALPVILLSPIAGVVADRVDQRRLLFVTQGLALVASLSLGLIVVAGRVELWHIYLQVVLQGIITAFDASVRQALFPRLVPRDHITEAVTLSITAGKASALIGPAIGGIAIALRGEAAPFLLNAASFVVLMGAVIGMTGVVPRTATSGSTMRGELIEGLRHIMGAPVLRGLLQLEVIFGIFQMNAVMITIVGLDVLGVGPAGLGLLLSAPALGSLLGIGGLLVLGQPRRQGRFVILCQVAYAGALLAFAISRDYALSFAILAVTGLLDTLATVTRHSVMQLSAPSHMRGRVMANQRTVTGGVGPFAQTQSGILAAAIGPSLAVVASGLAVVASAITTAWRNPTLWRFTRDDGLREPVAEELDSALAETEGV